MQKIVVIGSGNLAEALLLALHEEGLDVVQLYARNTLRGEALSRLCGVPTTNRAEELARADLYLVAVSDRAVGEVVRALPIPEEALVAHTAGSVSMELLSHPRRGVFYPFQSFTAGRRVDFREIPLFLEASDPASLAQLRALAERLSDHVYEATEVQRRQIHLTGVFACNFTNALYGVGADLLRAVDLPFEILHPLIMECARKAIEAPHPSLVQTGPAVRNDRAVQELHLQLLTDPKLVTIYRNLSEIIWETSKKTLLK